MPDYYSPPSNPRYVRPTTWMCVDRAIEAGANAHPFVETNGAINAAPVPVHKWWFASEVAAKDFARSYPGKVDIVELKPAVPETSIQS